MKKYAPCTIIFIGISGCGKGTQVKKVIEFLSENYRGIPIKHFESGQKLRDLSEQNTTFGNSVRRMISGGSLAPDSVANGLMEEFLTTLGRDEYCILDGYPRTKAQAINLDKALHSHHRPDPVIVIHIKLPEPTAINRLLERSRTKGRPDDESIHAISERIGWYERDVEPTIKFYKESSNYIFVEINGEDSVDVVYSAIIESIADYLVVTV